MSHPSHLEIRPGLRVEIAPVAGSARIQCRIAGVMPCEFDPAAGTWHAAVDGHDPNAILAVIAPADLALIETRLHQHAEACRRQIAAQNLTARFLSGS